MDISIMSFRVLKEDHYCFIPSTDASRVHNGIIPRGGKFGGNKLESCGSELIWDCVKGTQGQSDCNQWEMTRSICLCVNLKTLSDLSEYKFDFIEVLGSEPTFPEMDSTDTVKHFLFICTLTCTLDICAEIDILRHYLINIKGGLLTGATLCCYSWCHTERFGDFLASATWTERSTLSHSAHGVSPSPPYLLHFPRFIDAAHWTGTFQLPPQHLIIFLKYQACIFLINNSHKYNVSD